MYANTSLADSSTRFSQVSHAVLRFYRISARISVVNGLSLGPRQIDSCRMRKRKLYALILCCTMQSNRVRSVLAAIAEWRWFLRR